MIESLVVEMIGFDRNGLIVGKASMTLDGTWKIEDEMLPEPGIKAARQSLMALGATSIKEIIGQATLRTEP